MKNHYLLLKLLTYQRTRNLPWGISNAQFILLYYSKYKFSSRELIEHLGDGEKLDVQSRAILMENDIRDEEFTDEVKHKK